MEVTQIFGQISNTVQMIKLQVDADIQLVPSKIKYTYSEAVLCSIENDNLENVPLKFWSMIQLKKP